MESNICQKHKKKFKFACEEHGFFCSTCITEKSKNSTSPFKICKSQHDVENFDEYMNRKIIKENFINKFGQIGNRNNEFIHFINQLGRIYSKIEEDEIKVLNDCKKKISSLIVEIRKYYKKWKSNIINVIQKIEARYLYSKTFLIKNKVEDILEDKNLEEQLLELINSRDLSNKIQDSLSFNIKVYSSLDNSEEKLEKGNVYFQKNKESSHKEKFSQIKPITNNYEQYLKKFINEINLRFSNFITLEPKKFNWNLKVSIFESNEQVKIEKIKNIVDCETKIIKLHKDKENKIEYSIRAIALHIKLNEIYRKNIHHCHKKDYELMNKIISIRRNRNKDCVKIKEALQNIIEIIKSKQLKKGLFNNIFKGSGKILAFERKKLNSSYLFNVRTEKNSQGKMNLYIYHWIQQRALKTVINV